MTIKFEDYDRDILIDKKSCKNILVYSISYKTLMDPKPLCIRFDKMDGYNGIYDRSRYLLLFGDEKYDFIYIMIRYLIGGKSGITYVFSHNYAKVKVDSYDSLSLEKMLTFYDFVTLIKSVCNKDKITTTIYL